MWTKQHFAPFSLAGDGHLFLPLRYALEVSLFYERKMVLKKGRLIRGNKGCSAIPPPTFFFPIMIIYKIQLPKIEQNKRGI